MAQQGLGRGKVAESAQQTRNSEDSEDSGRVPGHSLQGLGEPWIRSGRPHASASGVDKRTARTRIDLVRGCQSAQPK
ncbi:hypothetical protein BM1_08285 [Bipolaris maydis]|nr:hypothetical protein BM1_08285 [Bipolaris maydis]